LLVLQLFVLRIIDLLDGLYLFKKVLVDMATRHLFHIADVVVVIHHVVGGRVIDVGVGIRHVVLVGAGTDCHDLVLVYVLEKGHQTGMVLLLSLPLFFGVYHKLLDHVFLKLLMLLLG
jgi:hypothetical protein